MWLIDLVELETKDYDKINQFMWKKLKLELYDRRTINAQSPHINLYHVSALDNLDILDMNSFYIVNDVSIFR